jgi:hypothetical protein
MSWLALWIAVNSSSCVVRASLRAAGAFLACTAMIGVYWPCCKPCSALSISWVKAVSARRACWPTCNGHWTVPIIDSANCATI